MVYFLPPDCLVVRLTERLRRRTCRASTTLDPWREKGIPLEQQYRSWRQRVKAPYDKHEVDAYTRTRVILMNGIEVEAWNYSHAFARVHR